MAPLRAALTPPLLRPAQSPARLGGSRRFRPASCRQSLRQRKDPARALFRFAPALPESIPPVSTAGDRQKISAAPSTTACPCSVCCPHRHPAGHHRARRAELLSFPRRTFVHCPQQQRTPASGFPFVLSSRSSPPA